jgi:hypothetical protein
MRHPSGQTLHCLSSLTVSESPILFVQYKRSNQLLPCLVLLNGLGKDQNGTPKWFDSVKYSAQPLKDCEVQNITAVINFQDRGHKLTVSAQCLELECLLDV